LKYYSIVGNFSKIALSAKEKGKLAGLGNVSREEKTEFYNQWSECFDKVIQ